MGIADLRLKNINRAFEAYDWFESEIISLGTAAVEIPTTPIEGAKELFVQNLHNTQNVFIGGARPYLIAASPGFNPVSDGGYVIAGSYANDIKWTKSAGGTNEYYATKKDGTALGVAEALKLYATYLSTHETMQLLVNGTVGALNNLEWDWGTNLGDALGFNTIYWRFNTSDPDACAYLSMLAYTKMPDSAGANRGIEIAGSTSPGGLSLIKSPTCKLFAIASGAATTILVIQRG